MKEKDGDEADRSGEGPNQQNQLMQFPAELRISSSQSNYQYEEIGTGTGTWTKDSGNQVQHTDRFPMFNYELSSTGLLNQTWTDELDSIISANSLQLTNTNQQLGQVRKNNLSFHSCMYILLD